MMQNSNKLEVFYDGGCNLCNSEIERYRKIDSEQRLALVDISEASFDPSQYDRDLSTFMKKLHVRDTAGTFHTGVDAFTRIWSVMPRQELHLLAAIVNFPGINLVARSGYWLFARVRKFLP